MQSKANERGMNPKCGSLFKVFNCHLRLK